MEYLGLIISNELVKMDPVKHLPLTHGNPLLCLAWVRTSVDLVGSRVLLVMEVQVDVEEFSI